MIGPSEGKRPRCWHLISNRWNSAITEYALSTARALALKGAENLFSPLAGSPAETRALSYGLKTKAFEHFGPTAVLTAQKTADAFRPDAVFLYGGPETFLAAFAGSCRKIRFRGSELKRGVLTDVQQRLSHMHINHILVPGRTLEDACSDLFGRSRVVSVILGCDTDKYTYTGAVQRRARPELMIFGRFDPVKGHREFLQIFRRIINRWPESQPAPLLTIAGEPANLTAAVILAEAAQLGLAEEHLQILCGRFGDAAAMMAGATMGVVSSLGSEQICRVAEEFLLCGTSVAVSGVGSLEDVLFKNAGVSYRGLGAEDAAALLRKAMLDAFAEPQAIRAERAARAKQLFSLEAMGERLMGLVRGT